MFGLNNNLNDMTQDLCQLLKEEGDLVQELSAVATKAATFHARLEAIEKALETNPAAYDSKNAAELAQKAKEKYSSELENKMKEEATNQMKSL